jgi:oligopeptidase B
MSIEPPVARQVPSKRTHHGDTVIDDYAWLTDKDDPATITYLKAENAYTDALTAPLAPMRETIFGEIKARTQESDLSVPVRKGGWWQYTRTVEGKQYQVHCRRAVQPGEVIPPMAAGGLPLDGEEVLLDGNALAAGSNFFSLGAFKLSPDQRKLAYSTDFSGDERFTLRVKDLETGTTLSDEIPGTYYGCAWSAGGEYLFYVTVDDAWRPFRVWRHRVGAPAGQDVQVFEEQDERFWVSVGLSRSERYVAIRTASVLTSEVLLLDAATPEAEFAAVAPRRQGVEYDVEDAGDHLLILHNDNAPDFELATAPVTAPAEWTPLIPHQAGVRLLTADAFADFTVVYFRKDGRTRLSIRRNGDQATGDQASGDQADGVEIAFPEPVYTVSPGSNPEFTATRFRLSYTSLVTPDSVYDCDMATGALTLLKRHPVLSAPGAAPYDPEDYEQHREWATAEDGTRVPISLVCRKGTKRDGTAPCLLYGYGSYEISRDPNFAIARLSLLDRGFVFAIAHVRGGGEMGRSWYTEGKLLHKKNTFTDFIACGKHLVSENWTSADRLVARGGSAGGLLMGAVANMAPEAFVAIVAHVPFVDPLNTILDPSLPLTVTEWEEWGDPLHDPAVYDYMKEYAPYENVTAQDYPAIFALGSLNDTRVSYHEPAKWVARLRATARKGPFMLKIEMEAGHGGRSGRYDAWREEALVLAWIIEQTH